MNLRTLALGMGIAALAAGCAGDSTKPAVPVAGVLSVVINAPDDSTGALLINISGGRVDSIVSTAPSVYSSAITSDSGGTVLFSGSFARGTVVGQVFVPDASRIALYAASVGEAANEGSNMQRTAGQTTVQLVQP